MSKIQRTKRNVMEGVPFTTIPDDFLSQWMTQLSPSELRVMLYIYLRTLGFGKQADTISYSQFLGGIVTRDGRRLDAGAGVSRRALVDALAALEQKGLIRRYHQVSGTDGPCSAGNKSNNSSSGKDTLTTFEVILLRVDSVPRETAVTQLLSSSTSTSTNALITSDNGDEKEQENDKGKAVRRKRLDENHRHSQHRTAHQVQSLPYLVSGDDTHTGVVSQPQVQSLPEPVQVLPSQRQDSVQNLHHNMRPESLTINNNHENRGAGASVSVSGTTATGIRASIPHDLSAAGASTAHGHLVDLASLSRNVAQPPQTVDQTQSAGLPTDDDLVYRERAIGIITSQVIGITPREASRLVELAFTRYCSLTHSPNPSSSSRANLEGVNPQSETTFPGVTTPTQNVAPLIPAGGGGAGQSALAYIERLVEYVMTTPGIHTPAAVLTTLVKTGQDRTKASERDSLYPRRRRPTKPGSFSASLATATLTPTVSQAATGGYPQVNVTQTTSDSTLKGLASGRYSSRMGYGTGPASRSGADYGAYLNNTHKREYPVAAAFVKAGMAQSVEPSEESLQQEAECQERSAIVHYEEAVTATATAVVQEEEEEKLDPGFLWMLREYTPKLAERVRQFSIEDNRLKVSFVGGGYEVRELVGWLSMAQIYYPHLEEIEVLR